MSHHLLRFPPFATCDVCCLTLDAAWNSPSLNLIKPQNAVKDISGRQGCYESLDDEFKSNRKRSALQREIGEREINE